jgi:benzoate-CoA ligase
MPELSSADHGTSPPRVRIPRQYNAAWDLIQRNLQAGRGGKTAFIDDAGSYTYGELAERVNRFGNVLPAGHASRKTGSCCACSTPSTSRRPSSAASRPASCRSPPTRC